MAAFAAIGLLLGPGLYNGFPLIFPDTQIYLKVAYGSFWTLDRSGFYGLLFKPLLMATSGLTGLWLALALQVAAVVAILFVVLRKLVPEAGPPAVVTIVAAISLLSALPWHASQLMPDALSGPLVLLGWYAASRPSDAAGSPLTWLAVAILTLVHFTHLGLLAVAAVLTSLWAAATGARASEVARKSIAAAAVVAAVCAAHISVNGAYFGRWSVSPLGSWFLFARLHEDGLIDPWLDRHCGRDGPNQLCALRHTLPPDSQQLLWHSRSPLTQIMHEGVGGEAYWRWADMLGQAAEGSIREDPGAFAAAAARGGLSQLATFQVLDDECPKNCASPTLLAFRPELAEALRSSRQLTGSMPKGIIRAVTTPAATIGLLLLLPLWVVARRRNDNEAASLLLVIGGCLTANALMAGALSDVHDRYQSRLVWLAPFAAVVLAVRWYPGLGVRARLSGQSNGAS